MKNEENFNERLIAAVHSGERISTTIHAVGGGEWSIEVHGSEKGFLFELVGSNGTQSAPDALWAQYGAIMDRHCAEVLRRYGTRPQTPDQSQGTGRRRERQPVPPRRRVSVPAFTLFQFITGRLYERAAPTMLFGGFLEELLQEPVHTINLPGLRRELKDEILKQCSPGFKKLCLEWNHSMAEDYEILKKRIETFGNITICWGK